MTDLLLHPKTKNVLDNLAQSPPHALLIVGELGAGKVHVANSFASSLLGHDVVSAPYYLAISGGGKSIGIEQIRSAQKFLQLKTTGDGLIRRVVLLEDADTMTIEAQNALLKILEEPPKDTLIVLTASQSQNLRPTIHSRVQSITVVAPSKDDAVEYFKTMTYLKPDILRSYSISNGQVGLMTAMLQNQTDHALVAQIAEAKALYGLSTFERIARVDELSKQKEVLPLLLFACKRICTSALEQAANNHQTLSVQTWYKQLKLVCEAEESLSHNPNTKLLLTDLFIQM